jgi:hypothetical protein
MERQGEREFTYQAGWKRKRMVNNAAACIAQRLPWIHRINIASIWRHAGTLPIGLLLILLWILPIVTFVGSLWLVHVLMVQTQ